VDVTFFLDDDVDSLRGLDPARDWRELQRGERAWVLQTWLHLAKAGHPARLSARLPESGIVVFHAKQRRAVRGQYRGGRHRDLLLVSVRGDLRQVSIADCELVQNRHSADGRRQIFVPHWPQPGLLPRDEARGSSLRRIAYKGFDRNLHPWFRGPEWTAFLAQRQIDWVVDSVPFAQQTTAKGALDWPDFRTVDLILAVRPPNTPRLDSKPGTKLHNAWLAGVPAVLGPEVAFRELRLSPLDYLEAAGPEEAKAAVERLLTEPGLYRGMVENGRRRAAEVDADAVLRRWVEVLGEILPARAGSRQGRALRGLPLPVRGWARRTHRLLRAACRGSRGCEPGAGG
jgi:hypothetical protein